MQLQTADFAPSAATWRDTLNTRRLWFWTMCSIMWIHDFIDKTAYNTLHCCQRRTEPEPQVTCTDNFMKFGFVGFFETREWTHRHTDRHTDTLIAILRSPTGDKVKNDKRQVAISKLISYTELYLAAPCTLLSSRCRSNKLTGEFWSVCIISWNTNEHLTLMMLLMMIRIEHDRIFRYSQTDV